ncbi:hypothetical protein MK280_04540, partial [Myxococcota bacterium]|nr:hypothetical protein [Myxococcota bacterium]
LAGLEARLEGVREALVRRSFEAWRAGEAMGRTATPHLLAQLHADRYPGLEELKKKLFEPVFGRYLEVVAEILPDQSLPSLRVGLAYASGLLLHTVGGHIDLAGQIEERPGSFEDADEALLRYLVNFAASGLRNAGSLVPRQPGGGQ